MGLAIDRYEVKRLIGQGAMGRIYLANDPKLGRDVAIKVLTAAKEDAAVRKRFRLEARAIAALKHPNIVELYDYSGEDAPDLFLVMEYVPGRTLQDHLTERSAMPEATVLCIAHELALALEHAHGSNVLHRDIKPDNVLLHEGRVVLTDFGIVKQIAEGVLDDIDYTQHTKVLGTPGFMAPEQFKGADLDPRTDLFALGAMTYYLATTYLPFPGDTLEQVVAKVKSGKFDDPRSYAALLSQGFCELVGKCLQPSRDDRFASAAAVRTAILELLRAHGVTEIRTELLAYEQNPSTYAVEQRERGLEVLTRDLKVAIKDRDEARVQAIVRRMQTIAPITDRVKGVSGLIWDGDMKPRLDDSARPPRRSVWFGLGMLFGTSAGVVIGLELLLTKSLPGKWMTWLERVTLRLFGP